MIPRSFAFNLSFYLWTLLNCLVFAPVVLGPGRWTVAVQRRWAKGVLWLMKRVARIEVEIRGQEHLPIGSCIVAAKHQSAWDTLIYHVILDDPAMVLKKELLWVPIYGWFSFKSEMIAIDRKAGGKALRGLIRGGRRVRDQGRPIVIFPQGTRVDPDEHKAYQPGVAGLYRDLKIPVIPVAVNSGVFWPRRKFLRRPGTLVLEYLEPMEPGLSRGDFTALLSDRIETATAKLVAEARSQLEDG